MAMSATCVTLSLVGLAGGQRDERADDTATVNGRISITITEKHSGKDAANGILASERDWTQVYEYVVNSLPDDGQRRDHGGWSGTVSFTGHGQGSEFKEYEGKRYQGTWNFGGRAETDLEVEIYQADQGAPLLYQFVLGSVPLLEGPDHQVTNYKPRYCPQGGEAPCTVASDGVRTWSSGGATIRDQRFDERTRVLSGNRTETSDYGRTVTTAWDLKIGKGPDTEAVVIPAREYPVWLPTLQLDQKTPDHPLTVTVALHQKGDPEKPARQKAKFKVELVDVSRGLGVCLNWPPKKQANLDYDLMIEQDRNMDLKVACEDRGPKDRCAGLTAESFAFSDQAVVTISPFDWGAWGSLRVTASLEDGTKVTAHLDAPTKALLDGEQYALSIPKDNNKNHIADRWEESYAGVGVLASDDGDAKPPGDGDGGDGLSLYEEYRGFRVQGGHIRTSPLNRDLFVYDKHGLNLGDFAKSELALHLVTKEEFGTEESGAGNPRVINFNRGTGQVGPQHVIGLEIASLKSGVLGKTFTKGRLPALPKMVEVVKIDVAQCLGVPKYGRQELQATIAHELAHACHVVHHGDTDYRIEAWDHLQLADMTWRHFGPPKPSRAVAAQGGQHSGVEECIMRYDGSEMYETTLAPIDRWKKEENGPVITGASYGDGETPGSLFCKDDVGTGVNDPKSPLGPKAGKATRGICASQFCVNDSLHWRAE